VATVEPARTGPQGQSLADIAALVAGVAIVLWLPWLHRPEWIRGSPWSMATWVSDPQPLLIAGEALGNVALALVPLVIVRSARLGRWPRSGEFLLACLGLPWLAQGIHDRLMLAWLRQNGIDGGMLNVPVPASQRWMALTRSLFPEGWLAVAVVAAIALIVGRKRFPGWLLGALLMVAWLGLREVVLEWRWHEVVSALFRPFSAADPRVLEVPYRVCLWFPTFFLFAVPAASAIVGRPGEAGPRRSLLERIGLILGAPLLVTSCAARLITLYSGQPWRGFVTEASTYVATLFVASVLAALIVLRLDPAWRRRRNVDYDGQNSSPTPMLS
jgi:hypothetical protein